MHSFRRMVYTFFSACFLCDFFSVVEIQQTKNVNIPSQEGFLSYVWQTCWSCAYSYIFSALLPPTHKWKKRILNAYWYDGGCGGEQHTKYSHWHSAVAKWTHISMMLSTKIQIRTTTKNRQTWWMVNLRCGTNVNVWKWQASNAMRLTAPEGQKKWNCKKSGFFEPVWSEFRWRSWALTEITWKWPSFGELLRCWKSKNIAWFELKTNFN